MLKVTVSLIADNSDPTNDRLDPKPFCMASEVTFMLPTDPMVGPCLNTQFDSFMAIISYLKTSYFKK